MLTDNDEGVGVLEWWDILGFDKDLKVTEVGKMNLIKQGRGTSHRSREQVCCRLSLWQDPGEDGTPLDQWQLEEEEEGDLKKGRRETERKLQECLISCFDRVCLSAIIYRL